MAMLHSIKGLVALVTGGGSGLGRATAERFVRLGASVVVADLPSSDGEKAVAEMGDGAVFQPLDVTSEAEVQTALNTVHEKFQRLDVIVNCAGIVTATKTFNFLKNVPHNLDEFQNILKVNSTGTFNVIRLGVGLIGQNEPGADGYRGVVVNTSSIAAFEGQRGQVAYAASKGAVAAMTLPLARDLANQGIRCVTVAPGLFMTPMMEKLPEPALKALSASITFPKRLGKPEEFAHLIQFVVENPMMNGEVIRLDGGIRMQM